MARPPVTAHAPVDEERDPPGTSSGEVMRLRDQLRRQAEALRVLEGRSEDADATTRPYLDEAAIEDYERRLAVLSGERSRWEAVVEESRQAVTAAEAGRLAAAEEVEAARRELEACRGELVAARQTPLALSVRVLRAVARRAARRWRRDA